MDGGEGQYGIYPYLPKSRLINPANALTTPALVLAKLCYTGEAPYFNGSVQRN